MGSTPIAEEVQKMMEGDINTMKDFLAQYNRISQVCFRDCVRDFKVRLEELAMPSILHVLFVCLLFFRLENLRKMNRNVLDFV